MNFSKIKKYNTKQEKDILIEILNNPDINNIDILKILDKKLYKKLKKNYLEILDEVVESVIMYKRLISVSEIVEISSSCKKCKNVVFYSVNLKNAFKDFKEFFKNPFIDNKTNISDLSLEEIENIEKIFKQYNKEIYNNEFEVKCNFCGNTEKIKIDIKKIISKFSLKNIYEQYRDLSYYSSITKLDVDSMYPFEREIFMGLLQEKLKNKDNE